MKKKLLSVLLSTAMVASIFAGCGSSEQAAAPAQSAAEEVVETDEADEVAEATEEKADDVVSEETAAPAGEVTYQNTVLGENADLTATIKWLHHKTDRAEDGTIDAMISAFNAEYPNITVEAEAVTDYAEDALLRLSTGDWGDIMFIPAVDKNNLQDYFMPMGETESMLNDLNFVNSWAYDGITYGVPYMANAQGVLYNKRIFKEAGVDVLPKTPTEFLDALQKVKDNTDAIPLYTNYAAGWTMGAWDAYIGIVSEGDDAYMNQKFVHTADPFSDRGDDAGIYNLYRILYDACSKGLIEDDYTTTDWEGCKGMLNRGEIASMVLGSWAYAQMVEADEHPEDVGYMPFPISVGGKQYVAAGGDYNYAINVNSSDENKLASMIFVKWMTEKSDWCYNEGGYTVVKGGKNPDMYAAFDGCEVLSDLDAISGEETYLNDMNSETELSFNAGGNDKVQRIVEAGATGSESLADILASWTSAWQDAQEELEIEVLY